MNDCKYQVIIRISVFINTIQFLMFSSHFQTKIIRPRALFASGFVPQTADANAVPNNNDHASALLPQGLHDVFRS